MWRPKPTQPRHPALVAKLEQQAARNRVKERRRAVRLLLEAGIDPDLLRRQGGRDDDQRGVHGTRAGH